MTLTHNIAYVTLLAVRPSLLTLESATKPSQAFSVVPSVLCENQIENSTCKTLLEIGFTCKENGGKLALYCNKACGC